MMPIGRGQPHAEKIIATPALAALVEVKDAMIYLSTLQFALGSLDDLKKTYGNQ